MNYKKAILIVFIIGALFYGAKFVKQDDPPKENVPPASAITPSTPSEFLVTVDAKGEFTPRHIRIKKGGKVTWINKSSVPVRPAVGPHPTHDQYPDFDSKQKIKTEETWSFVFQRLGMWQYHNHLRDGSMVGIVEVLAE